MDGLDCLGATDTTPSFSDFLKQESVNVMADTAAQLQKSNGKKAPDKKPDDKKKSPESWLTKPAIGPVPGWGVAAGGVGILGAAAYFLLR